MLCTCAALDAIAEEEVRIAIASGARALEISAENLSVFDADVGDRLAVGRGLTTLSVRAVHGGVRASGAGLTLDKKGIRARRLIFEAAAGIRVKGRLYFGRVTVQREAKAKTLIAINRLHLETYLLGIIGSEMSPKWPIEALKAQAVAARTYAMQRRLMMRAANRPYDLESSVLSQVYTGAERIGPSVEAAVATTRGEVLDYRHRLVEALYHSTCGGRTVPAEAAFGRPVPYLKTRRCRWCKTSTRYRWTVELSLSELGARLSAAKLLSGLPTRVERDKPSPDVLVWVGARRTRVSARAVRKAVGYGTLYSTRFTAITKGSKVRFTGRGFGHGVGMCQWGARGLALDGRNYREILGHYYKGASVKRLY